METCIYFVVLQILKHLDRSLHHFFPESKITGVFQPAESKINFTRDALLSMIQENFTYSRN